jgi:hypothetical protein
MCEIAEAVTMPLEKGRRNVPALPLVSSWRIPLLFGHSYDTTPRITRRLYPLNRLRRGRVKYWVSLVFKGWAAGTIYERYECDRSGLTLTILE